MKKTEFKSIEEMEDTLKALTEFVDDAMYGRIFELTGYESNLLHPDDERLNSLARTVEPYLNEEPELFRDTAKLSDELDERWRGLIIETRTTYLTIGIFLGACVADPSRKCLADLGKSWLRATLAQPRYGHLRNGTKSTRKRNRRSNAPLTPTTRT